MDHEQRITALEKEIAALKEHPKSGTPKITDIQTVFLQYCSERELDILEASMVLDRLKNGLQKQKCQVIPNDLHGGNY